MAAIKLWEVYKEDGEPERKERYNTAVPDIPPAEATDIWFSQGQMAPTTGEDFLDWELTLDPDDRKNSENSVEEFPVDRSVKRIHIGSTL